MEAGQIDDDGNGEIKSKTTYAPTSPPTQEQEHVDCRKFEPGRELPTKMNKVTGTNQESQEKDTTPSVANCYVFKSRLQEYCQKAGINTPVYETIKEGLAHQPSFKSTVVVNNVRYDSLPAFFNRKAAEQSAAEVALIELGKSNTEDFSISQHVHETGLCKNLLQEYTQKMNYAIPLYECRKEEKEGKTPMYSCVVEIGNIKYIGASASTKKEAEIKAARTALLAIQTARPDVEDHTSKSIYTVIPQKRKPSDLAIETKAPLKTKKCRFKKQFRKKKRPAKRDESAGGTPHLEVNVGGQAAVESTVPDATSTEPNIAAGVKVEMVGDGGIQLKAVNAIDSQGKTNGGSDIHEVGQGREPSVTGFVSSNVDSGTNTCSTYDGHRENAEVPSINVVL